MKTINPLPTVALAVLLFSSGCSFFSRQPPLPIRAALEPAGGDETFGNLVDSADIVYFPVEAVTLQPRSGAAWRLFESFKHNGNSFAVCWDVGAGDEKAHRVLMVETRKTGGPLLALHELSESVPGNTPPEIVPPAEDYERFARRFASRGLKEGFLRTEYEATLIRQQLAADKIASYFKEHRNEKILVFLRRDEVGGEYGVPYFVAQKTKARQLILNPQRHRESAAGLLAGN